MVSTEYRTCALRCGKERGNARDKTTFRVIIFNNLSHNKDDGKYSKIQNSKLWCSVVFLYRLEPSRKDGYFFFLLGYAALAIYLIGLPRFWLSSFLNGNRLFLLTTVCYYLCRLCTDKLILNTKMLWTTAHFRFFFISFFPWRWRQGCENIILAGLALSLWPTCESLPVLHLDSGSQDVPTSAPW